MTTITADQIVPRHKGIVRGVLDRLLLTYRLGGRTIIAAPVLLALAVLPEFIQHVVEIRLGMFGSQATFQAHAMDATRWAFGYIKVAGFALAILAVARFWAVASVRRTIAVPRRDLGRIVIGLALTVAITTGLKALQGHGAIADALLAAVSFVAQLGLTLYVTGALLSDPDASLRWSFTAAWPRAFFTMLLLAAVFVPCQALHMLDHRLAIGAPMPVVWALMLWDALFVGLFAALVGAATFVGYRYGPTWRGWAKHGEINRT